MSTHAPLNAGDPLAYFLTLTTYGTWLPGDDRGWHRKGEPEVQPPNPFLVEMARSRMKEKEFGLGSKRGSLGWRAGTIAPWSTRTLFVGVPASAGNSDRLKPGLQHVENSRLRNVTRI